MTVLYTAVATARLQGKTLEDASVTASVALSASERKYAFSVGLDAQVGGLSAQESLVLMHAAHEVRAPARTPRAET